MKNAYSQAELDEIRARVAPRQGWDFSRMADRRAPVPWDYPDIVDEHLGPEVDVLDIGTGGGELLRSFARRIRTGLGIDIDPGMVEVARTSGRRAPNVDFRVGSDRLDDVPESFHVILDRHAPFSLDAVSAHLEPDGVFITQQVGERNMANVKRALAQEPTDAPLHPRMFVGTGLELADFREYDVEYVVSDIDSLVFWLGALDLQHADVDGVRAVEDAETLNDILRENVTRDGFVTNEHRYLAVARRGGAS